MENKEIYKILEKVEVYESIPKEIEIQLDSKTTAQLWNSVRRIKGNKFLEELKSYIKNGIFIKFDIRAIIKNEVERYPANNLVKVRRRKRVTMCRYDDELDLRQDLMRDILLICIDQPATKPIEEEEEIEDEE